MFYAMRALERQSEDEENGSSKAQEDACEAEEGASETEKGASDVEEGACSVKEATLKSRSDPRTHITHSVSVGINF